LFFEELPSSYIAEKKTKTPQKTHDKTNQIVRTLRRPKGEYRSIGANKEYQVVPEHRTTDMM
jgi:hypothetical protein